MSAVDVFPFLVGETFGFFCIAVIGAGGAEGEAGQNF